MVLFYVHCAGLSIISDIVLDNYLFKFYSCFTINLLSTQKTEMLVYVAIHSWGTWWIGWRYVPKAKLARWDVVFVLMSNYLPPALDDAQLLQHQFVTGVPLRAAAGVHCSHRASTSHFVSVTLAHTWLMALIFQYVLPQAPHKGEAEDQRELVVLRWLFHYHVFLHMNIIVSCSVSILQDLLNDSSDVQHGR